MTIKYGLTIENQKLINEKAKTKNDGVYKFRGVVYRVINNIAKFYARDGEVMQNEFGFNVVIGVYNRSYGQDGAVKALKKINIK
jgi:hypothetical protein